MGLRNLQSAIRLTGRQDVTYSFHPFFLNRSIPSSGWTLAEYYRRNYGPGSEGRLEAGRAYLRKAGLECDPPIRFGTGDKRILFPTLPFHRAVEFLWGRFGVKVANDFQERCFASFFEREESLTTPVIVREMCQAAPQLKLVDAEAFLNSGDLTAETVKKADALASQFRVSGVPFFVASSGGKVGKFGVSFLFSHSCF